MQKKKTKTQKTLSILTREKGVDGVDGEESMSSYSYQRDRETNGCSDDFG